MAAASANAMGVVGIYKNDNGFPGTLLAQSAQVAVVAGWNAIAIPPTALPAGSYWLEFYFTGTTAQVYFNSTATEYSETITGGPYDSMQAPYSANATGGSAGTNGYSIYALSCIGTVPTWTPTATPLPCVLTFDSQTNGRTAGAQSLTVAHTIGNGNNSFLVVQVNIQAAVSVTSCTYAGESLTLAKANQDATNAMDLETWYLVNPPIGDDNVVVNISGGANKVIHVGALSYFGVAQTNPIGAVTFVTQASGTAHSVNLTTTAKDSVIVSQCEGLGTTTITTTAANQTQRYMISNDDYSEGDDLFTTTIGTYAPAYTFGTARIAEMRISVKAATRFGMNPATCFG
jgi:hypothetical protein